MTRLVVTFVLFHGASSLVPTPVQSERPLVNLATNRPCVPLPACAVLVDGQSESPPSAKGSVSKVKAVLTRTFKVVLPVAAFVERIVVHCVGKASALRGRDPGRQAQEHIQVAVGPDDVDHGYSRSDVSSILPASQVKASVAAPSLHEERGSFRLEIPVNSVAAVVSLVVQPPTDIEGSSLVHWLSEHGSLCGWQMPATEVAVMGYVADIPKGSIPMLKPEANIGRALFDTEGAPARRQNVNIAMSSVEGHLPLRDVAQPAPQPKRVTAMMRLVLPDMLGAFASWATWLTLVLGMVLIGVASISLRRATKLVAAEVHARADFAQSDSNGPAFFFIGDEDATDSSLLAGENYGCSASEPEPEAELDPPSCQRTPIGTPRATSATSLLTCPGTQLREVQPAPVALGAPLRQTPAASQPLPLLPSLNIVATPKPDDPTDIDTWSQGISVIGRRKQRSERQVVMMFSAPLCYADAIHGLLAIPQPAFDVEWNVIVSAHAEAVAAVRPSSANARRASQLATLVARPLTAANLQRIVAPSSAGVAGSVLHLSAHSTGESIILENGKRPCTAHALSCDQLGAMLDLRKGLADSTQLRFVIINACNCIAAGLCFVRSGVPHVLCTTSAVKDSWSLLFLHKLYSCLFQGDSVIASFRAALVALNSDPDISPAAASAFCLLPEGDAHDEVLFPVEPKPLRRTTSKRICDAVRSTSDWETIGNDTDVETNARTKFHKRHSSLKISQPMTPFDRSTPPLPEDLVGRSIDVWTVQQHLIARRIVVVCGGDTAGKGIGKSTVMDAVHRALTLQLGATCVGVRLRGQGHICDTCASTELGCRCWMMHLQEAIQETMLEVSDTDAIRVSRRCVRSRRCYRSDSMSTASGDYTPNCGSCISGTMVVDTMLESLITDMQALARLSRSQKFGGEWWPAVAANGPFSGGPGAGESGGALLILHNSDHLVQQQSFQEAIAEVLRRCPGYRIVLSTQRPVGMVGASWCQFKVVQHVMQGLTRNDAARLFLRRTHRAIRWEELLQAEEARPQGIDGQGQVTLTKQNEAEVLRLVSQIPAVAAQQGNPRALAELANKVNSSLANLQSLQPDSLVVPASSAASSTLAVPPTQGVMTPIGSSRAKSEKSQE